jgi:hypothetical protein
MKKLKLTASQLGVDQTMSRQQLKNVLGGRVSAVPLINTTTTTLGEGQNCGSCYDGEQKYGCYVGGAPLYQCQCRAGGATTSCPSS